MSIYTHTTYLHIMSIYKHSTYILPHKLPLTFQLPSSTFIFHLIYNHYTPERKRFILQISLKPQSLQRYFNRKLNSTKLQWYVKRFLNLI
jgi:hypothetical protein